MKRLDVIRWHGMIARLDPGLSVTQAARKLRWNPATTANRLRVFGYTITDGRRRKWPVARRLARATLKFNKVDWSMANCDIARKFGVSRERVRQVRKELGR